MKARNNFAFSLLAILLLLTACNPQEDAPNIQEDPDVQAMRNFAERVVVCNRGSADISVINARNNNIIRTVAMPNNGEPMYVVHIPQTHRVFVGDRANNRVVAFNERNFAVQGFAPAGNGVFHMWASPDGCQLWVNNDIDNTTTVIDPHSLSVIATVPTPADLVALGGKPHDVIVSPNNNAAFVTVLGISGNNDYVVKYNTSSFAEVARAAVGKDPHVSLTRLNNKLYVACQNTNEIFVLRRSNLSTQTVLTFDGAHGVGMSRNGRFLYVTDLPGNRLGAVFTPNNTVLPGAMPTPFSIPHNIAVNSNGRKIFVTHSGATADKLTIYRTRPQVALQTSLTLGTNPFGITYYAFRR